MSEWQLYISVVVGIHSGLNSTMKIAIAQTTATANLENNLKKMEDYVIQAKANGCDLITFAEMAYFSADEIAWRAVGPQYEIILGKFCALARKNSIAILPGTLREPSETESKFYNTLPFIDENGKILCEYRKIFLYKAELKDRSYDESKTCVPGDELVTVVWRDLTLGFSICFDLRFPELYRSLKKRGSQLVFLPSAFTVPTGQAHWEILVRARAIENQFFVVAPGLTGNSGDGSEKYGHSLVVGPWGEKLVQFDGAEGMSCVEINPSLIDDAKKLVDAWGCRNEALFPSTTGTN